MLYKLGAADALEDACLIAADPTAEYIGIWDNESDDEFDKFVDHDIVRFIQEGWSWTAEQSV
jgi:hypothetical protein